MPCVTRCSLPRRKRCEHSQPQRAYTDDSAEPAAVASGTTTAAPTPEEPGLIARSPANRVAPFFTVQNAGSGNEKASSYASAYASSATATSARVSSPPVGDLLLGSDAVLETLLMAQTLAAPTPSHPYVREPVLQVGAYPASDDAFALKGLLGRLYDLLAVARFDDAEEPVFAVRVFDVDTQRSLAPIEDMIRLGQPVSIYLLAR